jgi:hypothetical protein
LITLHLLLVVVMYSKTTSIAVTDTRSEGSEEGRGTKRKYDHENKKLVSIDFVVLPTSVLLGLPLLAPAIKIQLTA